MRALLELAIRGRTSATLVAAGCASCSLLPILRPLCLLTGAVVGLATLRYGLYEGLFVLASVAVLFTIVANFAIDGMLPTHLAPLAWSLAVILLLSWVSTWVMASALRRANTQGYALLAGALVGVAAILVFPLFVADSAAWWRQVIGLIGESLRIESPDTDPLLINQLVEVFDMRASVMTGMVVSSAFFIGVMMLLIARWWHAVLDNPGGFAREFRQLRLDRWVTLVLLATLLSGSFAGDVVGSFGEEIFSVAIILFVFQGLAVMHALVAQTNAWWGWLLVMYVMVLFAPQMLLILATTGFLDSWLDFRKRVRSRTT